MADEDNAAATKGSSSKLVDCNLINGISFYLEFSVTVFSRFLADCVLN